MGFIIGCLAYVFNRLLLCGVIWAIVAILALTGSAQADIPVAPVYVETVPVFTRSAKDGYWTHRMAKVYMVPNIKPVVCFEINHSVDCFWVDFDGDVVVMKTNLVEKRA